jgi:hypothetical protein
MTSSGIPLSTVRAKSVALTPCGHGSIYAGMELKQKFETLQTAEETLFANRESKKKNAPSNEPNTLLRVRRV